MPAKTKKELWKGKREQGGRITLPSGTEVRVEVPDVVEMVAAGAVPNPLVKFAVEMSEGMMGGLAEIDVDKIKEAAAFKRWLVATTVKDPEDLEPDDVPGLPTEDTDMIFEFATRQRTTDAVGHQLHGLETMDKWRSFHRV